MLQVYLIDYFVALIISLLVNWYLLKRYTKWGVKNHTQEGQERWVAVSKPAVGGIGFFVMFILSLVFIAYNYFIPIDDLPFMGFVGASIIGFGVGLIDDKFTMPAWFKFVGQIVCALVLFYSGIFIEINQIAACNFFITLFWVVGIMNAVNMLDNMDGITATTAYFVILSCIITHFSVPSFGWQYNFFFVVSLIILGGISGFLKYNWASAKMYMGDSGSQFLGAFLAALSIIYLWNFKDENYANNYVQWRQFAIPLIAFVVPIIDTTTVFIRRIARGQSPFVGGRDHTTHQLAIAGLSDGKVGLVFMAINIFSMGIIYWLVPKIETWKTAYTLGSFFYFVVLFLAFQLVYWKNNQKRAFN